MKSYRWIAFVVAMLQLFCSSNGTPITARNNGSVDAIDFLLPSSTSSSSGSTSSTSTADDLSGLVVVGGRYYTGVTYKNLKSVEESGFEFNIPDLPLDVHGNTLNVVNNVLYSCGGVDDSDQVYSMCFTLNLNHGSNSKWIIDDVRTPTSLSFHTGVTVGTHIWFTQKDGIHDFDTETYEWEYHLAPFIVSVDHCAVSNSTHSYVLGVGNFKNEIWVNTDPKSPVNWQKVGELFASNDHFGCIIFANTILVTGGNGVYANKSQIFDIETQLMVEGADLNAERGSHRMFLLNGAPAVIGGGLIEDTYDSVEYYSYVTQTWITYSQSLEHERDLFGLAQITP